MSPSGGVRKVIFDTDAGVDDALALVLLLRAPDVDVIGITCCAGNVELDQVVENVLKVLAVCNANVPVYRGAPHPLLGQKKRVHAGYYHGSDGRGDSEEARQIDITAQKHLVSTESAAMGMYKVAKEAMAAGDKITLIAVAPLTNLAAAHSIDPCFSSLLKEVVIMGGNMEGKGNITLSAEFNFYFDPEAANIVLEEFCCPLTLYTWELCLEHPIPATQFSQIAHPGHSPISQYLFWISHYSAYTHHNVDLVKMHSSPDVLAAKNNTGGGTVDGNDDTEGDKAFVTADPMAVASWIDPSIVLERHTRPVMVELGGHWTRGMCIVDWEKKAADPEVLTPPFFNKEEHRRGVGIPTRLDTHKIVQMMLRAAGAPTAAE
ncbi:unnamed protein product [Vitrella brassicaformis CCMP3155]|uniref:Inosine/uridine-preferring nucleoside hydrolase domain-containing protein n=2 Tax=Vitrella brassicaformis TaxID=1169539 RepID=A0A0G4EXE3_VITBC|nr:unnamed protein product [Vitrella brassicaformis CCMP3155]|eukprot:CEM03244.1 unnamed protein product [Vitrella brassicaformis CCMP3155]